MEITLDWLYGYYTGFATAGLLYACYRTFGPKATHAKNTSLLEWWVKKAGNRIVLKLLCRRASGEGDFITVDFDPKTSERLADALHKGSELIGEGNADGSENDN